MSERGLCRCKRRVFKDLSDLIAKAAKAVVLKNWVERGEVSLKLAQAGYLRIFRRKIALAVVRA